LQVQLIWCEVHLFTTEVFDSEAHTAKLDGVKLFDFVIKFAILVLERSHNEPETVNGLLFGKLIRVFHSMLNVKTIIVLFELCQCLEIVLGVASNIFLTLSGRYKLNVISNPNNFSCVLRFQIFLINVS